jgi:hypothetical protein
METLTDPLYSAYGRDAEAIFDHFQRHRQRLEDTPVQLNIRRPASSSNGAARTSGHWLNRMDSTHLHSDLSLSPEEETSPGGPEYEALGDGLRS